MTMPESKPSQSHPTQEAPLPVARDSVAAKTILVFGDAAIDWYEEKRNFPIRNVEAQALPSPELPRGWIWHETPGGCLLLDRMIWRLLGKAHRVVSPVSLRGDVKRTRQPREIYGRNDARPMNKSGYLHSLALIDKFNAKQKPDEVQWRVSKFLGFNIAAEPDEQKPAVQPLTYPDAKASETEHADVLVIDDAGWSFRHGEADDRGRPVWPKLLANDTDPPGHDRTLVLKIGSAGGEESPLWKRIKAVRHRFNNVVIVVNAVDLRRSGLDISHRLSWDRTVQDLALATLAESGSLCEFTRVGHVVVRFDFDGAVIVPYRPGSHQTPAAAAASVSIEPAVRLLCDPWAIEGDFFRAVRSGFKGGDTSNLSGGATAFVAGLVGALVQPAKDEACITDPERPLLDASSRPLVTAVSRALAMARTLYERGLGPAHKDDTDATAFDLAAVFAAPAAGRKSTIARFKAFDVVPAVKASTRSPLITSVGTADDLALEFARNGESVLERLPVLRYGDFTTSDPQEIENYRAIANLIETQLATGAPKWRLSLGVFGPPGAGKSFGVKSIARSLVGDSIRVIDANVAQFSSSRDLTREFHSARDETLRGKIPLLFFDEFDTAYQASPRGWLRFFLAPMQDGMFFDDAREHAIERAIFVFAGGTANDLSDFYNPDEIEIDEDARQQKVPDFVSRLHGVINVRGPDPRPDTTSDPLYAMRRATLLRAKLFDYGPNLFEGGNKKGAVRIAESVLRALLKVPKYHHGARSIDAIIRMSGITPAVEQFEQSMLPSRDQLRLHVNAEKFEEELRR